MQDAPYQSQESNSQDVIDPKTDLLRLGPYVRWVWERNADNRRESGIDAELLACLLQIKSEYSAEDKARYAARGVPLIYIPHSDTKRRTANSWSSEIFLNSTEKPYTIKPTPIADLGPDDEMKIAQNTIQEYIQFAQAGLVQKGVTPEQAMQMVMQKPPKPEIVEEYAKQRREEIDNQRSDLAIQKSERMAKKIDDQVVEGLWREAMNTLVDYCSSFGTAVMKGPVPVTSRRLKYSGKKLKMKDVEILTWKAISPFDCYPSKGAVDMQDGDFCQVVRMTPAALNAVKKEDKYNTIVIDRLLSLYPRGGLSMNRIEDPERKRLENDGTVAYDQHTMLEGIEFWGDIRGNILINDLQIRTDDSGDDIEVDDYYEVNALVFDSEVVFCSIVDPQLGRPVFKGTFYDVPGSWWGESPMKKMRDLQKICNASARSLVVNMAQASGPQMAITDVGRLVNPRDTAMIPWKVWLFKNTGNGNSDIPVKFFQPGSNAGDLLAVSDRTERQIDTVTGIPAYSHGSDIAAGAGRTASGLSMLMGAATRGMKSVVFSLGFNVLCPSLTYLYVYNMLYDEDEGIKGDCNVDVGGTLALLVRDQAIQRLQEFMNLALNPNVISVIGETGLAELLRRYMTLIEGLDPDNIIPTREALAKKEQMQQIMAQMQQVEQQGQQQEQQGQQQGQTAPRGRQQLNSPESKARMRPDNDSVPREGSQRALYVPGPRES